MAAYEKSWCKEHFSNPTLKNQLNNSCRQDSGTSVTVKNQNTQKMKKLMMDRNQSWFHGSAAGIIYHYKDPLNAALQSDQSPE